LADRLRLSNLTGVESDEQREVQERLRRFLLAGDVPGQATDASSYEQVVPKDHFLVKINEIIPWQRFTYKLVKHYKGKAKEGRLPYDPALLLSHRDPVRKDALGLLSV